MNQRMQKPGVFGDNAVMKGIMPTDFFGFWFSGKMH